MMDMCSADFCKLTLQEVADMLLDQEKNVVMCCGMVEGELYTLTIELNVGEKNG
jgi:hypothetical protein